MSDQVYITWLSDNDRRWEETSFVNTFLIGCYQWSDRTRQSQEVLHQCVVKLCVDEHHVRYMRSTATMNYYL